MGSPKEITGNLWEVEADLRVITTNGTTRKDGAAVMGRGCAREARDMFPGIDKHFGELLLKHGNRPMRLRKDLATLPVKHHWKERADLELIEKSIPLLVELVDRFGYQKVVVPRPGCGNGGLRWSEVRRVVLPLLDERFSVIGFKEEC